MSAPASHAAPTADAQAPRRPRRAALLEQLAEQGFIVFFAVWVLLLWLATDTFMTSANLLILLRQASIYAIVGIGATMIVLLGELDISFGAVLGLAGSVGARLVADGAHPALGLLAASGIGLGLGAGNGVLVTKARIPSVVATLGTMGILTGVGLLYTHGTSIVGPGSERLYPLAQGRVAGVPAPVLTMFALYALAWVWLARMRFGSHLYAAGDNAEAAVRAGIPVERIKLVAFAVAGALAGFAGMLEASRLGLAQATMGQDFLFPVLTAVILGGVSLTGGRGRVLNTMIASVFLASLTNGLILLGVESTVQQVVQGGVLILAVSLDRLRS